MYIVHVYMHACTVYSGRMLYKYMYMYMMYTKPKVALKKRMYSHTYSVLYMYVYMYCTCTYFCYYSVLLCHLCPYTSPSPSCPQTKLVNVAESISAKLAYFNELERLGSRLNSPTHSVSTDSFVGVLTRLDECINFTEQNVRASVCLQHAHAPQ